MTEDRKREAARYLRILWRVEQTHALTDHPIPELEGMLSSIDPHELKELANELDGTACPTCGHHVALDPVGEFVDGARQLDAADQRLLRGIHSVRVP